MIDRIFQTVKTLVNTDGNGNFKPKSFDLLLNNVVLEKFEELLFEVNRLVNRQNRGLVNGGLENVADKVRERIQHYLVEETTLVYENSKFTLPANLRYFDTVFYLNEAIELCNNNMEFKLISNLKNTAPEGDYPIGLKQGNTIKVAPSTIITNVTATYLRNPLQAKWTYQIIDGVEIFNPSANDYVDVDIHPGDEDDVILRVLKKFGINLKEKDIQEITSREEINEFTAKNTN